MGRSVRDVAAQPMSGPRLGSLLLVALACSACTSPPAASPPTPTVRVTPVTTALPAPHPTAATGVVTTDRGWTTTGLAGPVPAPGACHFRTSHGESLPDPACTPGAVDRAVTDTTISTTICRPGGYTTSVRPPSSLTGPMKLRLLAAYGIDPGNVAAYELDHLVPLEDGGSSDVRNLWPEANVFLTAHRSTYVHNDKDAAEAAQRPLVCSGRVSVGAVQTAMATDWTTLMGAK